MKILYISMTGMTEPLGESQVVQYLLELAKKNSIYLLSFEKPTSESHYIAMQNRLKAANIEWRYFKYSNRFGVISTAYQICLACLLLRKWIKKEKLQLVHARSLVPAVIGRVLKFFFKTKLLFDIRGFAIDEKIVDGRLKEKSILTSFLKNLEAHVYKSADHIVTLTHASKPVLQEKYKLPAAKITVIPTCASLDVFKLLPSDERLVLKEKIGFAKDDYIVLHNGSLNGWVDFDAELKLFKQIAILKPNTKYLFLNQGQHEIIKSKLKEYNISEAHCKITSAEFSRVYEYLNIADICVFFIKPCFAKTASAPTKFAEMVACQLLSVTNTQYGDMEYYLKNYAVGVLLDLELVHKEPLLAANKVAAYLKVHEQNVNATNQYTDLFDKHFSKYIAIERYQQIYHTLLEPQG